MSKEQLELEEFLASTGSMKPLEWLMGRVVAKMEREALSCNPMEDGEAVRRLTMVQGARHFMKVFNDDLKALRMRADARVAT